MNIKRNLYHELLKWKLQENRLPLLLRGARQVGKTTLVRAFSNEFVHYLELNLEREQDKSIVEKSHDISDLLNAIALQKKVLLTGGATLLFIDEIQESPKTIQNLRYFYEDMPQLFIIAAGSLLEFALKDVASFPVGRVDYLNLHPINFDEFLAAENPPAREIINQVPLPAYAHELILNAFHEYAIVGGMPQILSRYIDHRNMSELAPIYKRLWQAYKDDVEKYAKTNTERMIIRHVIETAPKENDRIKFEGFGNSNYRSREVGEALRALDLSRIIQLIYPTTNVQLPVFANLRKRPRIQLLDTGMLNQILYIQGEIIGIDDLNHFYKGKIIQHLIYQEFISIHNDPGFKPHFWVREEKDGNAEVDLVVQHHDLMIPIEIKSGSQGTLRSLHQFIDRTNHVYAVRMYAGNFNVEEAKTPAGKEYYLMNLPYFLGTKLPQYLEYFTAGYK